MNKFHLIDLPTSEFCVLLDDNIQRNLIESAAENVCEDGKRKGKYKKLAKILQDRCKSIENLKLSSIQCNYFSWWKSGEKFIPIDCLIELCSLANHPLGKIEKKIKKVKFKHEINRNARQFDNIDKLFKFKKELDYFQRNKEYNFEFINYFYGIVPTENDKKDTKNFLNTIRLRIKGQTNRKISELLNVPKRKIDHWISGDAFPNIIRFLRFYFELGKPKNNMKWLSINSTKGGVFGGPWIQVPEKISNFNDISTTINQVAPLPEFYRKAKEFKIDTDLSIVAKLFAFVLGILIGDSSKHTIRRKRRVTRRITLRLSKRYLSNEKLGEFTSMCINSLELRMNRCKDCPAGKRNPFPFYTWISQSSSLIQWMFSTCIGLMDDEKTTYNSVRADWILTAPREFKIWFLQGLAESDGFVDFSSCQVGIITHPNTIFIRRILQSLGLKSTKRFFTHNGLWSLMMNVKDCYNLPLFNPFLKSYRFIKMKKLFKAKRISGHWPKWLNNEICSFIKQGLSGTKLVEKIIDKHGILVRAQRINRKRKILFKNMGGNHQKGNIFRH